MKQSFILLTALLLVLVSIAGATIFQSQKNEKSAEERSFDSERVHIVTSFYPLGQFAQQVGGNLSEVSVIVPAGVEPHEYEPTPQEIASIYAADIFIANGAGIDPWAIKIQADLENKGVKVIMMSQVLGFDDATDPHFWIDPLLAQKEVNSIKDTIVQVDIKNQEAYTQNTEAYIHQLQLLDQLYASKLALCENRAVVTSHNAFNYLALRYKFKALSIAGFSPESEPSTQQLARLAILARQKNMRFIFFETLVSPRLAQTLADEIGAQTLVFNPLEGLTDEEVAQGKNYITIMEENLNNLQLAMNCHGK
jgi:zinc transport system substrate-binding protein